MTLDELITLVTSSTPEDWHTTVCWGADSGPSYRDHLNFYQVYDGQPNVLFAKAHSLVACYKPDLSVTMAWGLDAITDFEEPWANKFPDPKAASHHIDLFYNNALVFRTEYVSVDGGRAKLATARKPRRTFCSSRLQCAYPIDRSYWWDQNL